MVSAESQHRALPWRVHTLAPDFTLLDVWDIPLDPAPGRGFQDLHRLASKVGTDVGGGASFLMRLRERIGAWFGWDAHNFSLPIPGCAEKRVAERLTDEDRRRQRADAPPLRGGAVDDLRPVYLFDEESLQELSNRTIHALLHLSWVPGGGRLAVYVKHRGRASRIYMAAIKPFRHAIVYPTWIRAIQRAWRR